MPSSPFRWTPGLFCAKYESLRLNIDASRAKQVKKLMAAVHIHQLPLGPFQVFTYIVSCPRTGESVVIDPAGEADRIADLINEKKLRVVYILNTHGHGDHVLANQTLKRMLSGSKPIPVCMHEADDRFFSDPEIRAKSEKELGLSPAGPVDISLKHGDVLIAGTLNVIVLHTPGHTPGSACFLIDGNLFTGDTLFVGAVGRTDLVGGSLDNMLESLKNNIIVLPGETVVWPGHDYGDTPTSTIAREMVENPYITDFL
jgi:hydroxyacylglutathione hydrolase